MARFFSYSAFLLTVLTLASKVNAESCKLNSEVYYGNKIRLTVLTDVEIAGRQAILKSPKCQLIAEDGKSTLLPAGTMDLTVDPVKAYDISHRKGLMVNLNDEMNRRLTLNCGNIEIEYVQGEIPQLSSDFITVEGPLVCSPTSTMGKH